MRFLSSISNFSKKWISPVCWIVILMIAIFMLLCSFLLSTEPLRQARGSRVASVRKELKFAQNDNSDKKLVVFLGASTLASAVNDRYLDQAYPKYKYLNLSILSMTPTEYRLVLNGLSLKKDKISLFVIAVMPTFYNLHSIHPVLHVSMPYPTQYQAWVSWRDRIRYPKLIGKFDLIVDGLCGRNTLKNHMMVASNLWGNFKNRNIPPPNHSPFWKWGDADSKIQEKQMSNDKNFQVEQIRYMHLKQFQFDDMAKDDLYCALNDIRESGIPVVLLNLPVRESYYDVIALQKRQAEFKKYVDMFQNALVDYRFYWTYARDCEFADNELFADYGHFSMAGQKKFSDYLMTVFRKNKILAF